MDKTFDSIWSHVKNLEIIDTHEHVPGTEAARPRDTDFLKEYLHHYFNCDLISEGLKRDDFQKVIDHSLPLHDRWNMVEPYWEAARNTGYARSLDITAKELYGVPKICRSTIDQVERGFQESLKPGTYRKILKEKSKIRISLLDQDLNCDRDFFRSVSRIDIFVSPSSRPEVVEIEKQSGIRICCMADWLEATEIVIDKNLASGAVAFKCALAYLRSLHFERATLHEAEKDAGNLFEKDRIPTWLNPVVTVGKNFENYMMHFIMHLANRRNLVFQFHTGLQEGTNHIRNADPTLLTNLFIEYPDVDFDLFHIGYPYQNTLSALAKYFPNVFIDMCWAHIISPEACVNALVEWLDSVPANKISAFGGDYAFIDGIYGHQYMARQNVSRALAIKVNQGIFDVDRAKEIAEMLFYKNPIRIFRLQDKL